MRHRKKGSRLNRKSAPRKALLRNLVTSLVLNEKMVTTEAKAKELIKVFDPLVIKARNPEKREAIRDIKKVLFGEAAQRKLMDEILPQLEGRTSGFTTRKQIGFRNGDGAPVVQIALVTYKVDTSGVDSSEDTRSESDSPASEEKDNS